MFDGSQDYNEINDRNTISIDDESLQIHIDGKIIEQACQILSPLNMRSDIGLPPMNGYNQSGRYNNLVNEESI